MVSNALTKKRHLIFLNPVHILLWLIWTILGITVAPLFLTPFWEPEAIPYLTVIGIFITMFTASITGTTIAVVLGNGRIWILGFPFVTCLKKNEIKYMFITNISRDMIYFIPKRPYKKYEKLGIIWWKNVGASIEARYNDVREESGERPSAFKDEDFFVFCVLDLRYIKGEKQYIPVKHVFEVLRPDKEKIGPESRQQDNAEKPSEWWENRYMRGKYS